MDRGSRLMTFFQGLEKLNQQRQSSKYSVEDLQQLRYTTAKILQLVSSQERLHRDLILKSSENLDLLFTTLQYCGDTCTEQNIVWTLNELVGKSQVGKKVSTLISHGAINILLHTLVYEAKEASAGSADELLISIHQLLSKLAPKDRKFGVKARLSGALSVTLTLVKNHAHNPKVVQPIVHVLRLYSNNAVNASYLGKSGAVSHIFKVLASCQKKHLNLLKYSIEALASLVKSKSNSARAIGQGGVPVLLMMFQDWHRVDSKNRNIALRKSILVVLKHITNLKSGRNALMEADGIRVLYTACQESIDIRELESLIFMASLVMRKCFPRNRLPISTLRSPVTCPVPESEFHTVDAGEGAQGDDNGYESSVDNDDDLSSDDDPEASNKAESDEDGEIDVGEGDIPTKRSAEDLKQYAEFFPELTEFDSIVEENLPNANMSGDIPIVIPTAATADGAQRSLRNSQSAYVLSSLNTNQSGSSFPHRASMPYGMSNYNTESVNASFKDLRIDGSDLSGSDANGQPTNRSTCKGYYLDSGETSLDSAPAAVNLKTGSSVFTLEFSPKMSRKTFKSPKTKRKGIKSSKADKSRRNKSRNSKNDDWLPLSSEVQQPSTTGTMMVTTSAPPALQREKHIGAEADDNSDDEENSPPELDEEYCNKFESADIYCEIASQTKSVGRFNKIAYPDMHGHLPPPYREPLFEKKFGTQRQKIFEDIDRFINCDAVLDRVVYDLDAIVATAGATYTSQYSNYSNRDELRVNRKDDMTEHLKFNSQFECGNLRKAIQVRKYEYDLILNPDVNTNHHHQWFYFELSNMEAGQKYRFNIVNCEKLNSQFNFGMKPVMFSVTDAVQGRPHWTRVGTEICYYKNHFVRSAQTTGGVRGKTYYTATFSITFKHDKDVCYLAYHYPYTYSMLMAHLYKWENTYDSSEIYFRKQMLTQSLGGNQCPVLTITSHPQSYDREGIEQLKNRPYMFLSSRVHPGESNSSWVMRGTINFLLSDKQAAKQLRDNFIFKIVPMLNPDGVINGNHRCSLTAEDLNRRWLHPCPKLHPIIYHTKGLLQYMQLINKPPMVFCDYHGHSRRKNVFLYGCSPSLSWMTEDLDNPSIIGNKIEDTSYKTLPRLLHHMAPAFSINNCSFMVEKSKESTARVVVWRQIGIVRSYTMESSYCGCDQGPYRSYHISTRELEEMGRKFCEALGKLKSRRLPGFRSGGGVMGAINDAAALGLLDKPVTASQPERSAEVAKPELRAVRVPSPDDGPPVPDYPLPPLDHPRQYRSAPSEVPSTADSCTSRSRGGRGRDPSPPTHILKSQPSNVALSDAAGYRGNSTPAAETSSKGVATLSYTRPPSITSPYLEPIAAAAPGSSQQTSRFTSSPPLHSSRSSSRTPAQGGPGSNSSTDSDEQDDGDEEDEEDEDDY